MNRFGSKASYLMLNAFDWNEMKAFAKLILSWGLLGAFFALPIMFTDASLAVKAGFVGVPAACMFLCGVGINYVILWFYHRSDSKKEFLDLDDHWGVAEPFLALARHRAEIAER